MLSDGWSDCFSTALGKEDLLGECFGSLRAGTDSERFIKRVFAR
jgi:hypothetical protein